MTKGRIAAIVAAATLGAAAFTGAAVALAADDTSSPSAGGPSRGMDGHGPGQHGPGQRGPSRGMDGHGPGQHGPGQHGPGGDMLHSEGVIEDADGNFITVRMQQGEATAVSATSITVVSADGYSATYAIDAETIVERHGEDGALQVGDSVHVRAVVEAGTAQAQAIHALSPEDAKEREEHRAAMQDWMSERPGRP